MNISGWEYDFESLPRWENRAVMFDCQDYLFESPDASRACLIYSVSEVGMMNHIGFCAIFQNKAAPELLLHIPYVNFMPQAKFSKDGNLLFLRASYRYGKRFILVLDLRAQKYAIVHFCAPVWYELVETESGLFQITFDTERNKDDRRIKHIKNTLIDPEALQWRKWKPLAEGGDLRLRQRGGWRDRFKSPEQIWEETLDLAISQQIGNQEFVDLNRKKTLYYFVPFTQKENGKWSSNAMKNDQIPGDFQPAFTTPEACQSYLEQNGMQHVIIKGTLQKMMKSMDSNPFTHHWGVVIDPYGDFVAIPGYIRVTPKSLRY